MLYSKQIELGLQYIANNQLKNGGFNSWSSSESDFKSHKLYKTTFIASTILGCLSGFKNSNAKSIRERLFQYLLTQKTDNWSFNYWDNTSKQYATHPYPDDLDDTFCALAALHQHDEHVLSPDALALITHLLIACEKEVGGPYKTWLVSDSAPHVWQDIDLAVNANIAHFLSLKNIKLKNLNRFIEGKINANKISSPYYPSIYPIIYFISRISCSGSVRNKLKNILIRHQNRQGYWENPLYTALSVTALIRLGYSKQKLTDALGYLANSQNHNGSWLPYAFCADPSVKGKKFYAAAPTLTTAFCIEAMNIYTTQRSTTIRDTNKSPNYQLVVNKVQEIINDLPPELQKSAQYVLDNILFRDTDSQIILLPWIIEKTIQKPIGLDNKVKLASVSLWGWMAYTTYDDFLDNEGNPWLLSAAHVAQRNLVISILNTHPDHKVFQTKAMNLLVRIDEANTWETRYCRGEIKDGKLYIANLPDYGDYWQLVDRSLGHTISALGTLYAAEELDEDYIYTINTFFKHYLIARQLDDDAHDWEDDLRHGHINAAATLILAKWQEKGGDLNVGISINDHVQEFKLIFWEEIIVEICQLVQTNINLARRSLNINNLTLHPDELFKLLVPVEQAAKKALQGRKDSLKFIKNF